MEKIPVNQKIEIELKDKQLYLPVGKALLINGIVEEINLSANGTFLIINLKAFTEDTNLIKPTKSEEINKEKK